jgi:hypothetical protein
MLLIRLASSATASATAGAPTRLCSQRNAQTRPCLSLHALHAFYSFSLDLTRLNFSVVTAPFYYWLYHLTLDNCLSHTFFLIGKPVFFNQ